jgi:hypothetical protein
MSYYYVIKIEFVAGTSIESAIDDALQLSEKTGKVVEFDFNGKLMNVCWINQLPFERQINSYTDIYYAYISDKSNKTLQEIS